MTTDHQRTFPADFLWGASTAAHQIEGSNVNSDCWVMEHVQPSMFVEPSGDAADSLHRWPDDLDLAQALGLNTYRFSLEWARIEPEEGHFSNAMLDYYQAIIAGCHARGLKPVVTFNHFSLPRWFAADAAWLNPHAPRRFARYCERAARHLGQGISHALTFNEPNIMNILSVLLPPHMFDTQRAMLEAAARATASAKFIGGNAVNPEDMAGNTAGLVASHKAARAAIKTVQPELPVGLSLAMFDDQAAGEHSIRDALRDMFYQPWLDTVRGHDDFFGVQNYERHIWGESGKLPAPEGSDRAHLGGEVYPPSLANAVRYAHAMTGLPILVTEHGVGSSDDGMRARLIPAALAELKRAIDEGVPVKGYCHWSLLDNFEWIFGYKVKFGLHSVDPVSFVRTAKPSAGVYAAIVKNNAL